MKTKKEYPKDKESSSPSILNKPKTPAKVIPSTKMDELKNTHLTDTSKQRFSEPLASSEIRKKGPTTRIIVKYDVGFNNSIYLRGDGADLSWERGIMLKNIRFDEWVWETSMPFSNCEFKVLINDRQYELGENHHLQCGTSFEYTPSFHKL